MWPGLAEGAPKHDPARGRPIRCEVARQPAQDREERIDGVRICGRAVSCLEPNRGRVAIVGQHDPLLAEERMEPLEAIEQRPHVRGVRQDGRKHAAEPGARRPPRERQTRVGDSRRRQGRPHVCQSVSVAGSFRHEHPVIGREPQGQVGDCVFEDGRGECVCSQDRCAVRKAAGLAVADTALHGTDTAIQPSHHLRDLPDDRSAYRGCRRVHPPERPQS